MKNKIGGWGVVVDNPTSDQLVCLAGYEEGEGVTNNTMELTGVIEAMKWLIANHQAEPSVVYSDSEYVVKGINEWSAKWQRNGWKSTTGPVKNQPYWRQLLGLKQQLPATTFQWVRGHDNNEYNEVADRLCVKAYTDRLTERSNVVS